ncbi:hypothetical protein IWZ03DRAFT_194580 [Phyllosticta citriasiana]|uniref:Uncharacterized protein n=1 Tax=Phyllosticta citriasiana TaxID=595635 RepID=A0ABR1KQM0_9PEZI
MPVGCNESLTKGAHTTPRHQSPFVIATRPPSFVFVFAVFAVVVVVVVVVVFSSRLVWSAAPILQLVRSSSPSPPPHASLAVDDSSARRPSLSVSDQLNQLPLVHHHHHHHHHNLCHPLSLSFSLSFSLPRVRLSPDQRAVQTSRTFRVSTTDHSALHASLPSVHSTRGAAALASYLCDARAAGASTRRPLATAAAPTYHPPHLLAYLPTYLPTLPT